MARHKQNRSYVRKNRIAWTLELIVAGKESRILHKIDEGEVLDTIIPQDLAPMDIYVKKENSRMPVFFRVNKADSLKTALLGKLIVEFPRIHLFPAGHEFPMATIVVST